jgi:rhamnopyranosyl-N-acetylglucosaminyl-diphospho-decaprenol beta-1,3/1,4-galactofuranosyltransferase
MKICAIVVTYNRKRMLERCLRTILAGELVPEDTLVVDNASSDGTVEFVESTFPGGVSVLSLPQNRGGAGGFKAGLAEALRLGHEYFWLMDDDHEVSQNALRIMTDIMQERSCDVVGPVILSSARDGSLSWEIGPGRSKYRDYECMYRDWGEAGWFPKIPDAFNASLYRRSVFEKLGLPDDRLFIRGDEVEFGLRMEKHGTSGVVATRATVFHPAAAADKCLVFSLGKMKLTAYYTGNRLKDYCIFRNRAFYYKKYGRYKSLLLDPPRYLWFFLLTRRFDLRGLRLWMRGYTDGLLGHFGYERQLLAR